MNFGAMKDYKLKLRNLHASNALCCARNWNISCRLIGKLTAFFEASGVQFQAVDADVDRRH